MKEEKLFDMVKNIDEDLILEMLEYRPKTEDNICEGVLYSASEVIRKRNFWRYPVTVAALLLVIGSAVLIINRSGDPNNISLPTKNGEESSANISSSTIKSTEASEDTFSSYREENAEIVVDKSVLFGRTNVLFTNQYPEITIPDLSGAQFTEMSVSELCEYYELYNIPYEMKNGDLIEETDEKKSHGIYTLSDGSTYDINTFTFITPYDGGFHGKKINITIGRSSPFGQEFHQDSLSEVKETVYYNKEKEIFYMVFEKNGSSVMVFANIHELSDFDDPMAKEAYYSRANSNDEEYWQGVPCELELFLQNVALCAGEYYKYH